jgi:Family of unknown function (DUF6157)
VANLQFDALIDRPYQMTSDDLIFDIYARKNNIGPEDLEQERIKFFSKGQACLRCSPLTKRYGWGVHSDAEGKIAIYAMESDEYKQLANDSGLKHIKAMKSKA